MPFSEPFRSEAATQLHKGPEVPISNRNKAKEGKKKGDVIWIDSPVIINGMNNQWIKQIRDRLKPQKIYLYKNEEVSKIKNT